MDPIETLVRLFDPTDDDHSLKLEYANDLQEWAFKGGFRPTIASVQIECARQGVPFTDTAHLMCTLYGCPGA